VLVVVNKRRDKALADLQEQVQHIQGLTPVQPVGPPMILGSPAPLAPTIYVIALDLPEDTQQGKLGPSWELEAWAGSAGIPFFDLSEDRKDREAFEMMFHTVLYRSVLRIRELLDVHPVFNFLCPFLFPSFSFTLSSSFLLSFLTPSSQS
jgi:hypothetical protein